MSKSEPHGSARPRLSGRRLDSRRTVVIERVYDATPEEVWEMWTSKEGIESWWGPGGFAVTVHALDLRPGGELLYAMRAVAPEMVAYMKREGMPTQTEHCIVLDVVDAPRVLAYTHLVDFVPGVEAYDVGTRVELTPHAGGTRLVLTLDAMHDDPWTERASMGWQSELGKLDDVLRAAKGRTA